MINIEELRESDKGRIVVYKSGHGLAPPEKGTITSWNDKFIFVDYYGNGGSTATKPINLTWDKDDQLLTDLSNEINNEQSLES
jgi:hypothetical protein